LEQRRYARFELGLPVTFSWIPEEGTGKKRGDGVTMNISAEGVFIFSSAPLPPVGCLCVYETRLPWIEQRLPNVRLVGVGTVVRKAQVAEKRGFAVHARTSSLYT